MAQYKLTFIFNLCRWGWSETFYGNWDSFGTAKTKAKNLALTRQNLLGGGVVLEAVRISDVEIPRICGLVQLNNQNQGDLLTDTPWNAWILNICANDIYRRSFLLRGLPDDWIKFDVNGCKFPIVSKMQDAVNNWSSSLRTNGFQLKVVLKNLGNLTPHKNITLANGDGGRLAVTVAGVGALEGENLKMSQWQGPDKKLLNGSFKILKVAGDTYTLDFRFLDLDTPGDNLKGVAFRQEVSYVTISDVTAIRAAKKSTGRAFFVSRGRAPNRR